MPTEKPRVSIVIDDEVLNRIEKWQHKNMINSRSKAINLLLEAGLAELDDIEIEPRELDPIEEMDKLMGILADMRENMKKRG